MQNGEAPRVTMREIQMFVCSKFGLSHEVLLGDRKRKEEAVPRQLAMVLCRMLTDKTLGQIGEAFGRDHKTIMHAISKWEGSPRLFDLEREFKAHKGHQDPVVPVIGSGTAARLPRPIPSLSDVQPGPAPRPQGWAQMTTEERLTSILGMSLDRTFDYLQWDPNECSAAQLQAQTQLIGRLVSLLGKMGLQRLDQRHQSQILEKMSDVFADAAKQKP